MKQVLRSGFLCIVSCVASVHALHAQTVLYSTDFPDDQGWTLGGNMWAWWGIDAAPANVISSASWRSPPFSLNFNNDQPSYGFNGSGTASSPVIDLNGWAGNLVLGFWCIWSTEDDAPCQYDQRIVSVTGTGGGTFTCYTQANCGPPDVWHPHSVPLDAAWGKIRVQYYFNAGDGFQNDFAGWFIDDLEVIAGCLVDAPYCTPKLNSLGCSPTIFTTGIPSLSGTGAAFRIWSGGVLNQKVGLMLWSRSPASTPFGGGTLCVAAPITRTAAQSSGGTSLPAQDCTGTYVLQFTPAMINQAGLLVGDDVYSQYWSRDNGFPPPDNVGLTAGVHWEVCP